ncbi:MAG TPA: hypothetical protein VFT22_33460 [Kofleriaceae bacterium]|nr:hypothetical protein [Kofleriaceae bacterium]
MWLRRRDVAQALLGERCGRGSGRPQAVLDERDGCDLDQLRGGRLSATRSALVGMGGPELEFAGDLDRPAR